MSNKHPVLLALERLEAKLDDHDARVTDRLERLAEAVLYMSKTLHAPTEQEKVCELLYA